MKDALKFLESLNPSLRNEDVKNINTFSGDFLLYCIDKALKREQLIDIDNEDLINKYADRLCQQIYTKEELIELLTELCKQYHEKIS